MTRESALRLHVIVGFLGGGIAGALLSILGFLGLLPGFTMLGGRLLLVNAGPPGELSGVLLVAMLGGGISYAFLGAVVGVVVWRLRRHRLQVEREIPECPICGLRIARPMSIDCPQCGQPGVFAGRAPDSVQQPLCRKCKYNLTGVESGVCPECGEVL